MGLQKGEYDHEATSAAEATGYRMETIIGELVPRAHLLGRQIVLAAGACPTMAVEIMMDAPVLRDPGLDNRDRAMIVILSGSVVARDLLTEIVEKRGRDILRAGLSVHGFDFRNGQGLDRVFGVPEKEIAMLNEYATTRVFDGTEIFSRLVENVERTLDDAHLTSFQKAFIEAIVCRHVTGLTAHRIDPMALIAGPSVERALARG
jgi:hypothetical protein